MSIEGPPEELLVEMNPHLDNLLSDAEFEIKSRLIRRTLKCDNGVINFSIEQGEEMKVEFNFHRQSPDSNELIKWLNYPIEEIQKIILAMFEKVIHIPIGELGK
ncbi:hypothetical protein JXL19_08355 [bacterium]|nr:hypothetical protein [bacterium]